METFTLYPHKYNLALIGIAFFIGLILGAISMSTADAKPDLVSELRQSQSEIYNTLTVSKNSLQEAVDKITKAQGTLHLNAVKIEQEGF